MVSNCSSAEEVRFPPPRTLRAALLIFAIGLIAGSVVRYAYLAMPLVHDDWVILWVIGQWSTGRMNAFEAAFVDYTSQIIALWTMAYAGQLRLFGLDPLPWHISTNIVHAWTAALLFIWMRLYLRDWRGPAFASLVWSVAALGRWDNALLWVGMEIKPLILTCVLGSLIGQRLLLTTGKRRWGILSAVLLFLMVWTWQIASLFLATPLVQYFFLDRSEPRRVSWRTWAWTLVPAAASFAIMPFLFHIIGKEPASVSLDFEAAFTRTVAMFSVALANLTFWSAGPYESQNLSAKIATAVACACLLILATPRGRRVALVAGVPALILITSTNLRRADSNLDIVLSAGRYYYFPTLLWCVAAGVVVDGVARRIPARILAIAACLLLGVHAVHQNRIAANAIEQFQLLWVDKIQAFRDSVESLQRIQSIAEKENVALPDIPIAIPSTTELFFPLSNLAAVTSDGTPARAEFLRIDRLTPEDVLKARKIFRESKTPAGIDWSRTADDFLHDMQAVRWLDELAAARNVTVAVPDLRLQYGETHPRLADCVRDGLAETPQHLRFPKRFRDPAEVESLLQASDSPHADRWRRWLSQQDTPDANRR